MSGQLDDFADRRLRGDPSLLGHVIGGAAGPSGAGRGTPKPLHWTRIRVIAVVVGMALTVTVLAIVAELRARSLGCRSARSRDCSR